MDDSFVDMKQIIKISSRNRVQDEGLGDMTFKDPLSDSKLEFLDISVDEKQDFNASYQEYRNSFKSQNLGTKETKYITAQFKAVEEDVSEQLTIIDEKDNSVKPNVWSPRDSNRSMLSKNSSTSSSI